MLRLICERQNEVRLDILTNSLSADKYGILPEHGYVKYLRSAVCPLKRFNVIPRVASDFRFMQK